MKISKSYTIKYVYIKGHRRISKVRETRFERFSHFRYLGEMLDSNKDTTNEGKDTGRESCILCSEVGLSE